MLEKLEVLESRYVDLEQQLSDPAVLANIDEYQKYAKKHGELSEIVTTFREYKDICKEMDATKSLFDEDLEEELLQLAQAEMSELEEKKAQFEERLKFLLLPKDPRDKKNVIMEIRAGTGGEEAALFASDLFRMYSYYAERQGWKVEILSSHPTDMGGFKEIIFQVNGNHVFSKLKFESGAHRVQRIPVTESGGRIHTSAATVAVLPEAEEVELKINPQDLRIDNFCSSGPGGQSVNTTQSAVRITHLPTGMVVSCQDEKSQHKNKDKAMRVLRARLLDRAQQEQHGEISDMRRSLVGSGDRSERIRTYNFHQGRLTDHRIGLTLYRLPNILEGELDEVITALVTAHRAEQLKEQLPEQENTAE
ncbi:MAG TPA: peptide chain release factor 1 [Syntrophomonadaceae bacterium]|nr:peptide chain release factor 1 [Syntrophomonadaceae bacterium]